MTHVRTQIRDAFKDILEVAMPDHRVFASRKYSINVAETPMIDMRFLNENSEFMTMGSDIQHRTASLYIRITRSGSGDAIDDLLDDDAVIAEHAIADARLLGGLLSDIGLAQTNFTDSADGDKPLAELVLRYDVLYRVAATDTETPRG